MRGRDVLAAFVAGATVERLNVYFGSLDPTHSPGATLMASVITLVLIYGFGWLCDRCWHEDQPRT